MGDLAHAIAQAFRSGTPMGVLNTRTCLPVASVVEVALDRASRRRGLLGRRELPPGHALLLAPCPAVHTCFMQFAIDAVFLDRSGRVVKIAPNLRPWRAAAAARAYAVLELPAGMAHARHLALGDRLMIARS